MWVLLVVGAHGLLVPLAPLLANSQRGSAKVAAATAVTEAVLGVLAVAVVGLHVATRCEVYMWWAY